ncbi:hypothetical protein DL96DRAFT_846322 [Flagelloscypha sp. PMI_526]|nr:hypothetical protein DL96DRAFT_846322 [Flagelloscypha sp. PMI_526]
MDHSWNSNHPNFHVGSSAGEDPHGNVVHWDCNTPPPFDYEYNGLVNDSNVFHHQSRQVGACGVHHSMVCDATRAFPTHHPLANSFFNPLHPEQFVPLQDVLLGGLSPETPSSLPAAPPLVSSSQGKRAPGSAIAKRSKVSPPFCYNCGVDETPQWRKDPESGDPLCNACGLHLIKTGEPRPKAAWIGPIDVPPMHPNGRRCSNLNCGTTTSPTWRRDFNGNRLCNACGMYVRSYGRPRPPPLKTKSGKGRTRIARGEKRAKVPKTD